jgi:hypothetical protein
MDVEFMMRPPPFDEKRWIGKGRNFLLTPTTFQTWIVTANRSCPYQIILTKISSQIEK